MRQTFYCLTALPKDSDREVNIGHIYAQRKNAVRFADKCREHFRRITIWKGQPGAEKFADVFPLFVTCPECGESQADMGSGVPCESCGHPLSR